MKKALNYIISITVSIIACITFLPIEVEAYNKTYFSFTTLWNYLINNDNMCTKCLSYNIPFLVLIIEFLLIFVISFSLAILIDKRRS